MKKLISAILAILMLLTVFAACNKPSSSEQEESSKSQSQSQADSSKSDEIQEPGEFDIWAKHETPVKVSIGRSGSQQAWPDGDSDDNNAYTKWIKERLNIEVETAWYVIQDYEQKVNLAIVSDDLPDIMILNNQVQLNQLMESGMVADLTDAYNQYASPLLRDVVESYGGEEKALKSVTIGGRYMAMPDFNPGYQYALTWIRTDWLEKLNLPAPTTLEELIDTAKAFIDNDMAGNGNTVGIEINSAMENRSMAGMYNYPGTLDPIFNYYGAFPFSWYKNDSGEYVYGSVQPEVKQALEMVRTMYEEGVLDKEFATKDYLASIASGNCGIMFAPWWVGGWPLKDAKNNDMSSEWEPIECLFSPDGKYRTYAPNSSTWWMVVRNDYENPEVAIQLLNLLADVQLLGSIAESDAPFESVIPLDVRQAYKDVAGLGWGSWPINLTVRRARQQIEEAEKNMAKLERVSKGDTEGMSENELEGMMRIIGYRDGSDPSSDAWNTHVSNLAQKLMLEYDPNLIILDNFYPGMTPTMELKLSNLETLERTAYLQIVMGEKPLDYFDTFVEEWYAQGGSEITAEVNEAGNR